jgi:hypothetical protein
MAYFAIEGLWRIPQGGWANVSMMFVGGLCFVLVGGINQMPAFFYSSMRLQAIIGTVIVLAVEYVSGLVLNVWLGLGIWDYSGLPFNLHGQICLSFAGLWVLLMPFGIWLEDWITLLRYVYRTACDGKEPPGKVWEYTLGQAYRELIFGKDVG